MVALLALAFEVKRLRDDVLQHVVTCFGMLSHVADDAQYEHVERFVYVVDAHFMQASKSATVVSTM